MNLSDLKPGSHLVFLANPSSVDEVGFLVRQKGLEIRDCFSIQTSEGPLVVFLLRLSLEHTVLNQTLRSSTGVLNINFGRITTISNDPNFRGNRGLGRSIGGYGSEAHRIYGDGNRVLENHNHAGRFPSNLLLVHGPKCESVGSKNVQVRGGGPVKGGEGYKKGGYDHGQKDVRPSFSGYTSENGTEEITDWNCQPDCPVHLLDLQSFAGGIHGAGHSTRYAHDKAYDASSYDMSGERDITRYGDEGGASRFFKQASDLNEIQNYLKHLIQSEDFYE